MKKISFFGTGAAAFFIFMVIIPVLVGLFGGRREVGEDSKVLNDIKGDIKISYLDAASNKVKRADLEEYLVGVVAAEMPAEYNIEALKAQAVAARCFIVSKIGKENPLHPDAAVCTDPGHCKAYIDEKTAKSKWKKDKAKEYWNKIEDAVKQTKGEYMVCDDEVVEAFFFARSGGRTENSEDVWGEERPYLRSVESLEDLQHPDALSEVEKSNYEAREILRGIGPDLPQGDQKLRIGKVTRTSGGCVDEIEIEGEVFKGTEIRQGFGLKSANFSVDGDNEKLKFTVLGYGHGVGMSQSGANYMAENGKNYTEILSHYYTNIQIVKM